MLAESPDPLLDEPLASAGAPFPSWPGVRARRPALRRQGPTGGRGSGLLSAAVPGASQRTRDCVRLDATATAIWQLAAGAPDAAPPPPPRHRPASLPREPDRVASRPPIRRDDSRLADA